MPNPKLWSIFLVTLFLSGILLLCPLNSTVQADITSELQQLVNNSWTAFANTKENWGGGMAVFIESPGGNYFASVDLGNDASPDIHFRGASTTKTFTAAAIMWYHQNGLLNIDDYITDPAPGTDMPYVPDTEPYDIPNKSKITIRMLLNHRAGVFDITNDAIPKNVDAPYAGQMYLDYVKETLGQPEHTFTFDELVGLVAKHNLSYFKPDKSFHYSNIGYAILGKIIERLSQQSYRNRVQELLVAPNSLNNTSFPDQGNERDLPEPYAVGYVWYEGQLYETTEDNMSGNVAEGNVITTPRNLAAWTRALFSGNGGLNSKTVELMKQVKLTEESHANYGLGCSYTPGLGYGHNGGHAGYLTVTRYNPAYDASITLFCSVINFTKGELYEQLEFMYKTGRAALVLLGGPSSHLMLWHNLANGKLACWHLNNYGLLQDTNEGSGWNFVSETATISAPWQLEGKFFFGDGLRLFWRNTNTGRIAYWRLDQDGRLANETEGDGWGWVSTTETVSMSWRLVGVMELDGSPTLFWQYEDSSKVAYWRLNADCTLKDHDTEDGWGLVAPGVSVEQGWRVLAMDTSTDQPGIIWRNLTNDTIAAWKLNEKGLVTDSDALWTDMAPNTTVSTDWNLACVGTVADTTTLFWNNSSAGKTVYWRLDDDFQILDRDNNNGWGWLDKDTSLADVWAIQGITTIQDRPHLLWLNQNTQKTCFWRLTDAVKRDTWFYTSDEEVNTVWQFAGLD